MERRLLAIVCRNPQVGGVKTRLIPALGVEGARSLYHAFLQDLGARFAGQAYDLQWSHTPEGGPLDAALTPGQTRPQEGPDLGHRLLRIFELAAGDGYTQVVVISSDVPHLPGHVIDEAFQALRTADVVLAPSEDGGYHLVGMSGVHDIFTMVPMSTPGVFEQTLTAIGGIGLVPHILSADFDVDLPEDLPRLASRLARDAALCQSHTACVLRELWVRPASDSTGPASSDRSLNNAMHEKGKRVEQVRHTSDDIDPLGRGPFRRGVRAALDPDRRA